MKDQNIFILTGAGISAESGIHTYRDAGGLWDQYDPEIVSTYAGFVDQPKVVNDFYNMGRTKIAEAEPNAAHYAIGQLVEEYRDGDVTLITMNIDDLHERGGARYDTLHMHGDIMTSRCDISGETFEQHDGIFEGISKCDCCNMVGTLRPNVVWFGEMPKYMNAIQNALEECDIFVTIGTSNSVAPASHMVLQANTMGKRTYNLNTEMQWDNAGIYRQQVIGPATETVPLFVEQLLAGKL